MAGISLYCQPEYDENVYDDGEVFTVLATMGILTTIWTNWVGEGRVDRGRPP